MAATKMITLDPPLPAGSGNITSVHLKEPTAGQVLKAEEHLTKRTVEATRLYQASLIAQVSGIAVEHLDAMPMGAFAEAAAFLKEFVKEDEADDNPPDPALGGDKEMVIELEEPIELRSVHYTEISLAEPTLKQMRTAEAVLSDYSPVKVRLYQITMVALSADMPRFAVERLPISVLNKAAAFVQGFSVAGQGTIER